MAIESDNFSGSYMPSTIYRLPSTQSRRVTPFLLHSIPTAFRYFGLLTRSLAVTCAFSRARTP
jgi:hypothetical protein